MLGCPIVVFRAGAKPPQFDVAVPPDVQPGVIEAACERAGKIRGILAQKPLAPPYAEAKRLVERCEAAGVKLVVNQNMRFDHAVRACRGLLAAGTLGEPEAHCG